MHIPLALVGAAAHAQVLQRTAEARFLMAFEMVQGDDDVRVHHRPANHRLLHVLAAIDRNRHLVGTLQAVGNDHVAAGGVGGEAV